MLDLRSSCSWRTCASCGPAGGSWRSWPGSISIGHSARPPGFAYDTELDRYECPQGELLTLHTFDDRNKLAIYKAPASSCNDCVLKAFCTPHDEGRHVYRSLAEFHETDVGLFHRGLSLIILGVALAFCRGAARLVEQTGHGGRECGVPPPPARRR